jgi:hypothetical protein
MKTPRINFRSRLAAAVGVATLVGGVTLATAGPASAYGKGQVYQVELSANISGSAGGGVWLWFGLSSDHTGDYHGADCGHGGAGAASDGGDVTWQVNNNNQVVISGVVLNGLPGPNGTPGFPATVTVPAAYGHYTGTIGSFITLPPFIPPNIGSAQLQVAP